MRNRKANENYYHNITLSALSKGKLLTDQQKLVEYKYGNYRSDFCGCSWMAVYNAMILLHHPQSAPWIIRWLDNQNAWLQGPILQGLLGTYPWTIRRYFQELGYPTSFVWGEHNISHHGQKAQVGIILYLQKNLRGHYVAFQYIGENQFHFVNEQQREYKDIRSFSDFTKSSQAKIMLAILIYNKK